MFILDAQRDDDVVEAFRVYREYLEENRSRFPKSAYDLATSDWFYDFTNHHCPHDSWLESIEILEPSSGDRQEQRNCQIRIKLLAAYHDGIIELTYHGVKSYELNGMQVQPGHADWRYDQFRLSEAGHLLHEIEWCSAYSTAKWIIEADDVEYLWRAKTGA